MRKTQIGSSPYPKASWEKVMTSGQPRRSCWVGSLILWPAQSASLVTVKNAYSYFWVPSRRGNGPQSKSGTSSWGNSAACLSPYLAVEAALLSYSTPCNLGQSESSSHLKFGTSSWISFTSPKTLPTAQLTLPKSYQRRQPTTVP